MYDTAEPWVPQPPDEPYPSRYRRECVICGEQVAEDDVAEMHDPENPEERGGIVHPECGLSRGWQVS